MADIFSCGSSNPAKAVLRGRAGGAPDNLVIYPPRCLPPTITCWGWWTMCLEGNLTTLKIPTKCCIYSLLQQEFLKYKNTLFGSKFVSSGQDQSHMCFFLQKMHHNHNQICSIDSQSCVTIVSSTLAASSPSMAFQCSRPPSAMFTR